MRALLPAVTARLNIGPGPVTPSGPANPAEAMRPDATMRKNALHKIRRPEAGGWFSAKAVGGSQNRTGTYAGSMKSW